MNKFLCFGSLNIDYVYKVDHFVQSGETLSATELNIFPGGKGLNQAIALSRAGAEVYFAGKIGDDGNMLVNILNKSGVQTNYIHLSERKSGHAIIQVDKTGQNCIMIYDGSNGDIDINYIDEVLKDFGRGDIILLQNEINEVGYIMQKAKEKGLCVVFNPSPFNELISTYPLNLVDFFMINEIEGFYLTNEKDIEKIPEKLLTIFPESKIVLTLGKNGVVYIDKNVKCKHGIYDMEVADTTAAGDTFTGFFMTIMNKSSDVEKALKIASMASTLCVSKMGASISIPTIKEVLEVFNVQNN